MKHIPFLAAVLLGALAVAQPSLAADHAVEEEDTSTRLSLINPPAEISGVKIKHITVRLDQVSFGDCWLDRVKPGAPCVKPRTIDPGPHVIDITLDPLTSKYFHADVSFSAGVGDAWVLDLATMVVPESKQDDFLTVAGKLSPVEGCIPALHRIAALPSCAMAGLVEVVRAFGDAASQCGKRSSDDDDAVRDALRQSLLAHFDLDIEQCYSRDQIRKLPNRITAHHFATSAWPPIWPPDSLTISSWEWARDELPDVRKRDREAADVLDKTLAVMPPMLARFEVVDGVIDAYLKGDAKPVLTAAQQHWSLDPTTPEGHRTLLVLTDPRFFFDRAYSDFAADAAAADSSLACLGSEWQTLHLLDYFTARGELSPAAWRAVSAMMGRERPDGDYTPCEPAFDPRMKSAVPVAERLGRLLELDCSPKRPPARRGEWLKKILSRGDDRMPGVDVDLRDQLRGEFAGCLADK